MYTDPIADYLTRVRNAQMAEHKVVEIPASNMKKSITKILHDKGYILDYKFEDTPNNQGNIKIALKYNTKTKLPAIKKLTRISKPAPSIISRPLITISLLIEFDDAKSNNVV